MIRYAAATLILALLALLAGWYFFLRSKQLSAIDIASQRGFGASIPSFSGEGGSTFENIVAGLGFKREKSANESAPARLWRVSATPTSGFGFLTSATSTRIRFMERSTGYVFEADPNTGTVRRLTNTLTPKVYEAQFTGEAAIGYTLSESGRKVAFSASVGLASSSDSYAPLVVNPLGEGVLQITPGQTGEEFLSLVPDGAGSALIRSRWDGTKPERLFTSGLRDWRVYWLKDGSIVIAQRAATGIPGSAYRLGARGDLTLLARNIPGLTILPRASSETSLVASDSGAVSLAVQTKTGAPLVALPVKTIADKCVWASGREVIAYCAVPESINTSQFLDARYRGAFHTSDSWWTIDAEAGTAGVLYNPGSEGKALDVEKPAVDDTGTYLGFMNARDKSLWVLRIKE